MTFSLYDASVPMIVRGLNVLAGLIDKAAASGLDEESLMQGRLAPDMLPFVSQVRIATDLAKGAVARLADVEPMVLADDETTLAQLRARIVRTIAYVESVGPAQFAGAETRAVQLKFPGMELNFEGAGYLTSFALPNFYFHVTTVYALLRHAGVALGKRDYMGQLALA
ncbi:hypothetical protein HNP32_000793 [Brevundimonas bullata]|uniref:DUF1993 domain-containing protein n=1 Tax=Brevundimonas bullata TaxID=13160 RepID=A0A7W7IMJ1_9CAUL|nr:DUF1993 domain-containing protein [Brevundimonas bullata]MBB4797079.1 hypothetical protein [Brevundimonas bullata]MBB6382038.1 hypothetical protein [Brevundimonas bullata]